MKIAISIPDALADATDRLAERLGLSRSELVQLALTRLIEAYDGESITARLDAVYSAKPDVGVDPALQALQQSVLPNEDWD